MTNFDFLKNEPQFDAFSGVAIAVEQILNIDATATVLLCRRALEIAIKWIYSVDKELELPEDNRLASLVENKEFRNILDFDLYKRVDYIRRLGNIAAHGDDEISRIQAGLCIENLFYFMDFVAYCYGNEHKQREFDEKLLEFTTEEALSFVTEKTVDLKSLIDENKKLKDELTMRRTEYGCTYVSKPLVELSKKEREVFDDIMPADD